MNAALFNPFMVWAEVAAKTGEMMLASAQVIAQRTGRLAAAGAHPSVRDRKEFALMGQEKVLAANEAARDMALRLGAASVHFGGVAFAQMLRNAQSMMGIAAAGSPQQAMERQATLARRVMREGAATGAAAVTTAGRVAAKGLAPVRKRAKANARRLAKRK